MCNIRCRGWNEQEWQDKTNAILGNPDLQGIAWEFIPGAPPRRSMLRTIMTSVS